MFILQGHAISLIILILAGFSSSSSAENETGLQKRYVDASSFSLPGELNDVNENKPKKHLNIRVNPSEHQVAFREDEIDHSIQLKNGTKAVYLFGNQFNALAFEKDGWQYMLTIDKRTSDMVTIDMLAAVANTIIDTSK